MSEPDLTGQTLDGRYRITGLLDTAPTTPPRASEPSVRATSGPHLASVAKANGIEYCPLAEMK